MLGVRVMASVRICVWVSASVTASVRGSVSLRVSAWVCDSVRVSVSALTRVVLTGRKMRDTPCCVAGLPS